MPMMAAVRYHGLARLTLWPTSCQLRLRPKNQRRKTATSSKMMNLRYLRKAGKAHKKKSPASIITRVVYPLTWTISKDTLSGGERRIVRLNLPAAAEFPELLNFKVRKQLLTGRVLALFGEGQLY